MQRVTIISSTLRETAEFSEVLMALVKAVQKPSLSLFLTRFRRLLRLHPAAHPLSIPVILCRCWDCY